MKVSVSLVNPNGYNARKEVGDLEGLKASIEKHGFYHALLARPTEDGRYELAFGSRRLQALKELGCEEIEIAPREIVDQDMATLSLCENIHREDLTPVEVAIAYRRGLDATKLLIEEFSDMIGVSSAKVSSYLGILDLPEAILSDQERYTVSQLVAMGKLNKVSPSTRNMLENQLKVGSIRADVLGEIVRNCEKVLGARVSKTTKDNICSGLISQDYSHLPYGDVKDISTFTDALLQEEIRKYNNWASSRANMPRPPARGPRSIHDIEDADKELEKVTELIRKSYLQVQRADKQDYYSRASKRKQGNFKRSVNKFISGIEKILEDEKPTEGSGPDNS